MKKYKHLTFIFLLLILLCTLNVQGIWIRPDGTGLFCEINSTCEYINLTVNNEICLDGECINAWSAATVNESDPVFVAENASIWSAINNKLDQTDQRYNETELIKNHTTNSSIHYLQSQIIINESQIDDLDHTTDTIWDIIGSNYLIDISNILNLNETKLNNTIDSRISNISCSGTTDIACKNNTNIFTANQEIENGYKLYFGNESNYFYYNITNRTLQLWVNDIIQQDWGASTTVYGEATFIENATFLDNAFFQNIFVEDVSGNALLINTSLIVGGNTTIQGFLFGNGTYLDGVCHPDGTGCPEGNSTANYSQNSNLLDGYNSSFFMPLNKSVHGVFNFFDTIIAGYINITNNLHVNGSVEIEGNLSFNGYYAEVQFATNIVDDFVTFNMTNNEWINISHPDFIANKLNGFALTADGRLNVTKAGLYQLIGSSNFWIPENSGLEIALFINEEEEKTMASLVRVGEAGYLDAINFTYSGWSLDDGNLHSLHRVDSDVLAFGEGGIPLINVTFNFSQKACGCIPSTVVVNWRYDGSASHEIEMEIYNYTSGSFVNLRDDSYDIYHTSSLYQEKEFIVPFTSDLDDDGIVIIRLNHVDSASAAHDLYLDQVTMRFRNVEATMNANDLEPLEVGELLGFRAKPNYGIHEPDSQVLIIQRLLFNAVRVGDIPS